ncbi:MAG TPA: hypothetical protein VEZ13_18280 [Brevibacillus sp.]|nr:hypothetical protein [Brevibacillus sp.]
MAEPITKSQVKTFLRIEESDTEYDGQLDQLISAAREWCETYQNRAYITQTFELALDHFPVASAIRLPRPKLQTVDSIQYADVSGAPVVWPADQYQTDTFSEPGYLVCKVAWPRTNGSVNNVVITYTSGYGNTPDDVPQKIRQAIFLLVTYWFENGMCDPPEAVKSLLMQDRVIPV